MPNPAPAHVSIHPLVLLSVVDHFGRVAKNSRNKRVVGVLLGQWLPDNTVDVTNSYALPFEEDDKNSSVWFLDHNYHEAMYNMFKKVNAKEKIVGWYHSGPKLRPSDLEINNLFERYVPNPVLVIVEVQPKDLGIPTSAYFAVQEIHDDGTATTFTFNHIPSSILASEPEEIGVEHLLRDIKDNAIGTLSTRITNQYDSLRSLNLKLNDIHKYLGLVLQGKLPVHHGILSNLQDVFNLLPDLSQTDLKKSFIVQTNDEMLVMYLSSLVRSVLALHSLIDNKLENRDAENLTVDEVEVKEVAPIAAGN